MRDEMKKVPRLRFRGFQEDWELCKLDDLLNEVKRPVKIEDHKEYQLVTVKRRNGGVVSRGNFKGENILVKNYFVLKKNDYLISKRQVVHGANGIVPENMDGAVVSNEYLVSVGNESIKTDYLTIISQLPQMYKLFFLSSYGIDIEKLVFNVEDWKKRTMLVPNIDEQVKIASFFKIIDDTITLHQRKLDQLKELKKAYLQVMFPVKDERAPKLRFADFEGEWEQCKLEDYATYRRGSFPQPYGNKKWYDGENAMPFVQVIDVTEQLSLVKDTKQKISKLAQSKSVFVSAGKVVVTLQGSIGRVAITQYNSYIDRTLLVFESYEKETDEYFWAYTIQQKFEIEKRKAPGGTIKTITKEALSSFEVNFPEYEEQQKNGNFLKNLDNILTLDQKKLDQLKSLKKSYLQNMFI
ncbi:restriction endonuclease subunit S [Enterococcus faecalis]|uniref:restriction endonuclease subunit S n=1 Tax=Enterococcus faecalis TaxID=1351 RepID=UPI000352BFE1|nr:restriction endonuclease subunit S [Enterococcus faecalis]EHQ2709022.1 restriction endonuclease subunit S [Enterococcus faecalis]EKZ0131148.1 restriction endonuclease subunit S [Enterococcus faecalis]EPI04907.1 type I restriction modification DNA specificity domain protein [Enterococcus faecalis 20.SD.W.06]